MTRLNLQFTINSDMCKKWESIPYLATLPSSFLLHHCFEAVFVPVLFFFTLYSFLPDHLPVRITINLHKQFSWHDRKSAMRIGKYNANSNTAKNLRGI